MTIRTWALDWLALLGALALVAGCAYPSGANPRRGAAPGDRRPAAAEALSAWRDGPVKTRIADFIERVTDPQSPDFVAPEERVATFDMDGTILCEKPDYFEVFVAMTELCDRAKRDPAVAHRQPYRAACAGDRAYIDAHVDAVLLLAFEGQKQSVYRRRALEILATHEHPKFKRPYLDLTYTPMRQLVRVLRDRGFRVFIFSGSQQGFTRAVGAARFDTPPVRAAGRQVKLAFDGGDFRRHGEFVPPNLSGPGKALAIEYRGDLRPILAAGNTTGDSEMLLLTSTNPLPSLALVVDHDDAKREYAYRDEALLQQAKAYEWTVVRMASDFAVMFASP